MKACGIIAEFNPFHNGHRYLLKEARRTTKADVVIVVMSGVFLQRGEPAIIHPWIRAEEALRSGADLVIELPTAYSVQSADYFARGGVQLLAHLGVSQLVFGTDAKYSFDYNQFGLFYQAHEPIILNKYKDKPKEISYAQYMDHIFQELYPNWISCKQYPNHGLGISYAKENYKLSQPMELVAVAREKAQHYDTDIHHASYASGTAIRTLAYQKQWDKLASVISEHMLYQLQDHYLVREEDYWPYLKYRIMIEDAHSLKNIYGMQEGFEYKLLTQFHAHDTYDTFVQQLTTKTYTRNRIKRLLTALLLNMTQEQVIFNQTYPYLRVLGFNQIGREYLNHQKKKLSIPLITQYKQKWDHLLKFDRDAHMIYQLAQPVSQQYKVTKSPIYLR